MIYVSIDYQVILYHICINSVQLIIVILEVVRKVKNEKYPDVQRGSTGRTLVV